MSALQVRESDWQATVVELLEVYGYRTLHVRRSIGKGQRWATTTSIAGWPDLLAWRPNRLVAIELKSQGGKVTPEQEQVLAELADAGVETRVARPSDFDELARWLK
jgi:VRR-NUC domain